MLENRILRYSYLMVLVLSRTAKMGFFDNKTRMTSNCLKAAELLRQSCLVLFVFSKIRRGERSEEICQLLAVEIVVNYAVEFFPHRKRLAYLSSVALIVLVS